jgi:DNA modification methylase
MFMRIVQIIRNFAQKYDMNQLILGDNLEILKRWNSESVDLIYLDPPFFSNRNYEIIWGDAGEIRSFQDRWAGGISHYMDWLKERVMEMHRILKPTGSIFLHCDWHANAYIRVEILDKVFGASNFRNEIIWKRKTGRGETNHKSNKFGVEIDNIFFYSKSSKSFFEGQYSFDVAGYEDYVETSFNLTDENGRRYQSDNLASPTPRPNLTYEYKGYKPPKNGWAISLEKMEEWDKMGKLIFPKTLDGRIRRKRYLDELKGKPIQNLWVDIEMPSQAKERIGYPTQKPEKLLERIILCASNEGDVVLDPFVGGGTTIAVADRLKRAWIGMDQSVQAVKVSELRLMMQRDLFSQPFETQLLKYDFDTLRFGNAFEFETFIVTQFGGTPNARQRGDLGIDGKATDGAPIQVKRSDGIGRNMVDNFQSAITRYDKRLYEKNKLEQRPVGYLIAFSFGRGAIEEVARLKNAEQVILKLVKVEEIVRIGTRPMLQVQWNLLETDKKGLKIIEIQAIAKSETEIQFFSWDMDYKPNIGFKPTILLDKKGIQTLSLKTGNHTIAVKVVNEDGLETLEIVRLNV